jgi:hypothetical protein
MERDPKLNAAAQGEAWAAAGSECCWSATFQPHFTTFSDDKLIKNDNTWQAEYPWQGLFRVLVASYRYGMPHLAEFTLEKIKRLARQ